MVDFTFGDYRSLVDECGAVTGTITSSFSTAVFPGALETGNGSGDPYLIQAGEWGARAGHQWAEDVHNQWQVASSTCANHANWSFTPPPELTPEQAEESGRRRREDEYRRDRAAWRAEELLLRNLTPGQRASYLELGRFTVKTKRGHRYVIGKARSQNVVRVNRHGKPMRVYCVTVHGVPLADALLGQKLMLDHDESHFLKVARQWPVRFALGVSGLVRRPIGRVTISNGDESLWIPTITFNEAEAA